MREIENLLRQIRDLLTSDPAQRAEHFRADRLGVIQDRRTVVELPEGPGIVLHLLPDNAVNRAVRMLL